MKILLISGLLITIFFVCTQGKAQSKNTINIVGQVEEITKLADTVIHIKILNDIYDVVVDHRGEFKKAINAEFNFKRPILANLSYSLKETSTSKDFVVCNTSFLIDSNFIHINVLRDEAVDTILGGYENRVLNEFKKVDENYYKNIDQIDQDSNAYAHYNNILQIINKNNDAYISYIKLSSLLRPSAFSLYDALGTSLKGLNKISLTKEEVTELNNRYQHFLQERSQNLDLTIFPELQTIAFANDPKFASLKLKHKYVLIDVWATWCGPCIEQHPFINKLAGRIQKSEMLGIVGIATSSYQKDWANRLEKHDYVYPNYWLDSSNTDKLMNKLKITAIPYYMLISTVDNKIVEKDIKVENIEKTIVKYIPNAFKM